MVYPKPLYMTEMQDKDWHDRTPHDAEHVPVLAKVSMMLALAGLNGMEASRLPRLVKAAKAARRGVPPERLLKRYAPTLWKASGVADGGDDDSSEDIGAGGGNYSPDEPRVPAGQPGGGQWTTGGDGISPDSGSISVDDVRSDPSRVTQVDSTQPMAYTTTEIVSDNKDINAITTGIQTSNHGSLGL